MAKLFKCIHIISMGKNNNLLCFINNINKTDIITYYYQFNINI